MSTPDPPYEFNDPDADVILRAPLELVSDKFKDFHTHRAILSVASTFFHDMFSLPQPPQPTVGLGDTAPPVIPVAESAEVFETFLRLIYPIEPPTVESLQLVDSLFRLAEKYMVKDVHAKLKQIVVSSPFLKDDPILVYAVARRADLEEVAELAIPHTFNINLIQDIPRTHLQMMTAETYNSLLRSHADRRVKLECALNKARSRPRPNSSSCTCGSNGLFAKLHIDIRSAILEKPFLDKSRLSSCFPDLKTTGPRCASGLSCEVAPQAISRFFLCVLDEVGKLG